MHNFNFVRVGLIFGQSAPCPGEFSVSLLKVTSHSQRKVSKGEETTRNVDCYYIVNDNYHPEL